MPGQSAGRTVRRAAGALVALAACVVLLPSNARAGCAGHVAHATGRDALARFLDPNLIGDPAGPSAPAPAPARPRPCSGQSCSGNPAPPAAPSVSEARYVELWACLGPAVAVPEAGSGPAVAPAVGLRPVVLPAGVFHPPRRASSLPAS